MTHRGPALMIGAVAVLGLALPVTGWTDEDCGLCEPCTEVECRSGSAAGVT